MRERLLDLCLLAYPRARRAADRDFLRDLALDLAETQGFPRQAWSVLGGGLRERIQDRRRRAPVSVGGWAKRIVVGSSVLAALAFTATGLIAPRGVSEVEGFACQYECRETEKLIAARERAGWDCTTRRHARSGTRTTTWRCTRASNVVAWLGI